MTSSYSLLQLTFQAIFNASKAIEGRFHICPYWLNEINSSNLGELIKATISDDRRKYDAVFMMPPRNSGDFSMTDQVAPDSYTIGLFFLTDTYTSSGQIRGLDKNTNKSTHTIPETWHDMQQLAKDFMRQLQVVLEQQLDAGNELTFHINDQFPQVIVPVSTVGNDQVSGVMLQFQITMFNTCVEISDYPDGVEINLPTAGDIHNDNP